MTWGNPAVPIISAMVMQKTSKPPLVPDVYSGKPSAVTTSSSFCSSDTESPCTVLPKAICGIGMPVICNAMKTAGTV